MNTKLKILPSAREGFERNFFQLVSWINDLEINSAALKNNNLSSTTEYRRLLDKTKVSNIFYQRLLLKRDIIEIVPFIPYSSLIIRN